MPPKKLSVLILEPNALQCDLIKLTLLRNNMLPIICEQPDALRGHLVRHSPDVLLIDTYLPGQNGLDLLGQMQAEALLKTTRIFILSSMGFPEIVQKAARMGASGFLVKPIDPDFLVARILNSFGQSGQNPE